MKLTFASGTIDIGYAQYPASPVTELVQATDRSASGVKHTEDFSVLIGAVTYNFVDMTWEQYSDLLVFFVSSAEGQLNEFQLEDDVGVVKTVKFTASRLAFNETSFQLWSGSFTVENIS